MRFLAAFSLLLDLDFSFFIRSVTLCNSSIWSLLFLLGEFVDGTGEVFFTRLVRSIAGRPVCGLVTLVGCGANLSGAGGNCFREGGKAGALVSSDDVDAFRGGSRGLPDGRWGDGAGGRLEALSPMGAFGGTGSGLFDCVLLCPGTGRGLRALPDDADVRPVADGGTGAGFPGGGGSSFRDFVVRSFAERAGFSISGAISLFTSGLKSSLLRFLRCALGELGAERLLLSVFSGIPRDIYKRHTFHQLTN